jgi:hypothetical protein
MTMTMTPSQIAKTRAIAENLVGSEEVRGKAAHALRHDDPACLDCAAWRGRPDMSRAGASDAQRRLEDILAQAETSSSRPRL